MGFSSPAFPGEEASLCVVRVEWPSLPPPRIPIPQPPLAFLSLPLPTSSTASAFPEAGAGYCCPNLSWARSPLGTFPGPCHTAQTPWCPELKSFRPQGTEAQVVAGQGPAGMTCLTPWELGSCLLQAHPSPWPCRYICLGIKGAGKSEFLSILEQ